MENKDNYGKNVQIKLHDFKITDKGPSQKTLI